MLAPRIALLLLVAAAPCFAAPQISVGPIEKVHGGYKFTEGPTWTPEGLVFTDLGSSSIFRGDGVLLRKPTHRANGLAWDAARGRLLACEHNRRLVSARGADGKEEILATHFGGKRLNSPNDMALRKDGTIFFTDPEYGLGDLESEQGFCGVYAITPDGTVQLVWSAMTSPNGIALTPDEKTLYVADSEDGHIMAFDVNADNTFANPRMLAKCNQPDGIKVGPHGEVWATCVGSLRVFDGKTGAELKRVRMRETPANLCFAPDGRTLYLTAATSLYKTTVAWE